ncbi:MAG: class I SAM-dependent methyltransferase [Candidatus Omnitrophota bacterium]
MKLIDIKRFWENKGEKFSFLKSTTPTSRDPFLAKLEMDNIMKYLKKNFNVLELGCGDAAHTINYAKKVKHIFGLDYSYNLIKIARRRAQSNNIKNISFIVSSVTNLNNIFKDSLKFDCVISQRCLINLPSWEMQCKALRQIHSILKKGGLLLLSEGFQDELNRLNRLRVTLGLSQIKVVNYNRNFYQEKMKSFIEKYFRIIEIKNYGFYLLLSRLVYPLTIFPKSPKHDSRFNSFAMNVSRLLNDNSFDQYSYNLFYALKKV